MKRDKKYLLTPNEEEVMEFFWDRGQPMTSVDILASSKDHSWKDNYLNIMLRSLLNKNALQICGTVQYGNQYARLFTPVFTKSEYAAKLAVSRGIEDIPQVAVAMAKETGAETDEKLIERLENIIKELREK